MPNPRAALVGTTLMVAGTSLALVGQEHFRVDAYNQKEVAATRFASVVAEVRAALESKREEAERALVDRGKEKESISGYLKVADTKITAAERALEAAREEKIAKIHRLAEIDDAIREAREEAGKLAGDIADKVQKQAEAQEKLERAKAAADKARRGSWLPQTWWGGRAGPSTTA